MKNISRYALYSKHKGYKRGRFDGISTDSFERAKKMIDHEKNTENARFFVWFKIKDTITNKYVYEVRP